MSDHNEAPHDWVLQRIELDGFLAKKGWILQSGCADDIAKYLASRVAQAPHVPVSLAVIRDTFFRKSPLVAESEIGPFDQAISAVYALQLPAPQPSKIDAAVEVLASGPTVEQYQESETWGEDGHEEFGKAAWDGNDEATSLDEAHATGFSQGWHSVLAAIEGVTK